MVQFSRCISFRRSMPRRQSRCSHSRSGMKIRLGSAPRASRRDLGDHPASEALKPLKTSRRSARQPQLDASGSRGEGMVAEVTGLLKKQIYGIRLRLIWDGKGFHTLYAIKCPGPEQKDKLAGSATYSLPVRPCSQIHAPFGSLNSSRSRDSKHSPLWGITPYILETP